MYNNIGFNVINKYTAHKDVKLNKNIVNDKIK
jgi:hypothetical protein